MLLKGKLFCLTCYVLITVQIQALYSQISEGGVPYSLLYRDLVSKNIETFYVSPVDTKKLLIEDSIELTKGLVPFRFGVDIDVDINSRYYGTYDSLLEGYLWRIELYAEKAISINLIFKDFYLPHGAKLFLYTPDYKNIIGAFTYRNNQDDGIFATTVLPGERIILEYFEPYTVVKKGTFSIYKLIYGYKDIFFNKETKGYGSSGACNINVNCPDGLAWQDEKRAVVMILLKNNSRICTGTLVNNVKNDGAPYILTANHCLGEESTWIFMFNYESPNCDNINGPTNNTIQGSILRAKGEDSDFALVEMKSLPPLSYNVYYAGWSAIDAISDSCTVIHHPSGDIKKISFDYDTVTSSAWGSGVANSHWTVGSWEKGTTEPGSSGSPLFNKNKKIIGQLHGGIASCSVIGDDNFGKFSYSWDTDPAPSRQLKYWLDPDNTGLKEINGFDFSHPTYNNDAAIDKILIPYLDNICDKSFAPAIRIRNNGATDLQQLKIIYLLDNTGDTLTWNGLLPYMLSSSFVFPELNFTLGLRHLKIFITEVNGKQDENHNNDTIEVYFNIINGNNINLDFYTDIYPNETSWELIDSIGNVLHYSPVLIANTFYQHNFCLPNGCYDFYVYDSYGDGMSGSTSHPDSGYVNIYANGILLASGGGNFGNVLHLNFCVNSALIKENNLSINKCYIYPNPTKDEVNFIINNFNFNTKYTLYSITGNLIDEGILHFNNNKAILLLKDKGLKSGIYFCKIYLKTEVLTVKIILL
ncbi:MAG TPA: trypsin-like peptidase domain-containing protein [Bacteroidales bacterium]|mgnify:CR=1 FL=1|nr:trypsin-like peptidase domain-containing protein [Bacteroidales bacterium]